MSKRPKAFRRLWGCWSDNTQAWGYWTNTANIVCVRTKNEAEAYCDDGEVAAVICGRADKGGG